MGVMPLAGAGGGGGGWPGRVCANATVVRRRSETAIRFTIMSSVKSLKVKLVCGWVGRIVKPR